MTDEHQRKILRRWKKEDPEIDRYKICPKCSGMGEILKRGEFIPCPKCKGYKTVEKK